MFKPPSEEKIIAGIKFQQRHRWKMGIPLIMLGVIGFSFALWHDQNMRRMILPILARSERMEPFDQREEAEVERQALYFSGYRIGYVVSALTYSALILCIGGLVILFGGRHAKMLLKYYEYAHRED